MDLKKQYFTYAEAEAKIGRRVRVGRTYPINVPMDITGMVVNKTLVLGTGYREKSGKLTSLYELVVSWDDPQNTPGCFDKEIYYQTLEEI